MMNEPEELDKKELYKEWLDLKHFYLDKSIFSTILMFIGILYTGLSGKQAAILDAKHIALNVVVLLVVALIVSYILYSAFQEINNLILFIPENILLNFEDVVDEIFREVGRMHLFILIIIASIDSISVIILPKNVQNQISQFIYLISFLPLAFPFFYGVTSNINIYYKIHPLDYKRTNTLIKRIVTTIFLIIGVISLIVFLKKKVGIVFALIVAFYLIPVFVFLLLFLIIKYFKIRRYKSTNKRK